MALDWIKDLLRRIHDWIFLLRLRCGRKIMYDEQRKIVQISPNSLAKGPCTYQEIDAMQFVAQNTSISLPKIQRIHRLRNNDTFIVMDFIKGERVDHIWPRLVEAEKRELVERIWTDIKRLRECRPGPIAAGLAVGSTISGNAVRDGVVSWYPFGPYEDVRDFHVLMHKCPNVQEFSDFWTPVDKTAETRLTHGDLGPRNIIVRKDLSHCILDWEVAAWMPSYWEYVKWHFADWPVLKGWVELLNEVSGDEKWEL